MNDKKAKTRERILDAACSALIQHGPAEPSVNQVMGAAGLTVGGFYAHFDSKDALMLEAFRQLLGETAAQTTACRCAPRSAWTIYRPLPLLLWRAMALPGSPAGC